MSNEARSAALARLEPLVGAWSMEASFPSNPELVVQGGRCVFEWMKGGRVLIQRMEVPRPDLPDGLCIISRDPQNDAYTQHYFDSRGVARLYAMRFVDGVWTLLRETADFSPLEFSQRFTGTLADDGDTIRGAWEKRFEGADWELDFALTYRRIR